MSGFAVTAERLEVLPHPNADNLERWKSRYVARKGDVTEFE